MKSASNESDLAERFFPPVKEKLSKKEQNYGYPVKVGNITFPQYDGIIRARLIQQCKEDSETLELFRNLSSANTNTIFSVTYKPNEATQVTKPGMGCNLDFRWNTNSKIFRQPASESLREGLKAAMEAIEIAESMKAYNLWDFTKYIAFDQQIYCAQKSDSNLRASSQVPRIVHPQGKEEKSVEDPQRHSLGDGNFLIQESFSPEISPPDCVYIPPESQQGETLRTFLNGIKGFDLQPDRGFSVKGDPKNVDIRQEGTMCARSVDISKVEHLQQVAEQLCAIQPKDELRLSKIFPGSNEDSITPIVRVQELFATNCRLRAITPQGDWTRDRSVQFQLMPMHGESEPGSHHYTIENFTKEKFAEAHKNKFLLLLYKAQKGDVPLENFEFTNGHFWCKEARSSSRSPSASR